MIKTYIIETDTLPDPLEQAGLMNGFPKERIEKITRIRHPGARKQSFGAGLLMREILRKTAGKSTVQTQMRIPQQTLGQIAQQTQMQILQQGQGQISQQTLGQISQQTLGQILQQTQIQISQQGQGQISQQILTKTLAGTGGSAQIFYNSFGKPCLKDKVFSLSHTKNFAALSVWQETDGTEPEPLEDSLRPLEGKTQVLLGCDIEIMQPYNSRIARRFFTQNEYRNLEEAASEQEKASLFGRYWTRKESVMKLTGLGMALPMDVFDVCGNTASVNREKIKDWEASVKEKPQPEYRQAVEILLNQELFFKEYRKDAYCMTVCSTKNQFAEEIVSLV